MMVDTIQIHLLGPIQIERTETPLNNFRSRREVALLGYLIRQEQPVTRSFLANLFWPDKREKKGRDNLNWVVHHLLKQLPGCLQKDRQTISFYLPDNYWLDTTVFEKWVTQGTPETLTQALSLYRGEFMEGFYLDDCSEFEVWLTMEREGWRKQVIQVLEKLIDHHTHSGLYQQAISLATRLLVLEPWYEAAHQRLMSLLARNGQRTAALAQYETCRQILAEELGVEPSTETFDLYTLIRDGEFNSHIETSLPTPDLQMKPSVEPSHNLPAQTTGFVGRVRELSTLAKHLEHPTRRLVTIVGLGGVGKTRLALAVAERWVQASDTPLFPQGVFFVPLTTVNPDSDLSLSMCQSLNYPLQEDGRSPQQQLLDYLRQKQLLLVLDNFEHLLSSPQAPDLITSILKTAPGVKILVTSRERLSLSSETLFTLEGLTIPQGEADWTDVEAVQLLRHSIRRVHSDFELASQDRTAITRICHLLGGFPLGILLATAWVEILSLAEIAEALSQGLDLLETDLRDVPARQQSMRAVFDHSWQLLGETERGILQQLPFFKGDFTREAAQTVARGGDGSPASLRTLLALVSKSLLQRTPEGRFEMHELLRQYVVEKLEATAPTQIVEIRDRHSTYYCAFLQQKEIELKGPQQKSALIEIETDLKNVQSAWAWAVKRDRIDWLEQALDGLGHFYEWQGRNQDLETMCRLASEKLMSSTSPNGSRVLAKILTWQSHFLADEPSYQLIQKSLALLEKPGLAGQDTRSEMAFALLKMGRVVSSDTEANQIFKQSLALYQNLEDDWGTANALASWSRTLWFFGDYNQAKLLCEASLTIQQTLEDKRGMAGTLRVIGAMLKNQGQLAEAERLLRRSLAQSQQLGDQVGIADDLFQLGITLTHAGSFSEAGGSFKESFQIWNNLGHRAEAATARGDQGRTEIYLGRYQQGRALIEAVQPIFQETEFSFRIGTSLCDLAMIPLAEKAYSEAKYLLEQGIAILREIGNQFSLGEALVIQALAEQRCGSTYQAEQYLHETLQIATKLKADVLFWAALSGVALVLADQGEIERAVELYALASRYPYIANSQWFEDVAGQYIEDAAATLRPEVVAAAQERGTVLDLWAPAEALLVDMEERLKI